MEKRESSAVEERIGEWLKEGESHKLPAWDEFPAIPLYMDQVILYLKDSLGLFQREGGSSLLTSSMINNYVKSGVLPHPEKKKYEKKHLGALMLVCMLKQVLSLQDIKTLLDGEELGPELYRFFLETHLNAMRETCGALSQGRKENLWREALRLAVQANAQRAAAERILCELAKESPKGERGTDK